MATNRLFGWLRVVAFAGGSQAAIQVFSFLGGILVIRSLSATEYAYYTIANTGLGAISLLSDAGIGGGLMALGGRVWTDREALGRVLATGLTLRRQFAMLAIVASIPVTTVLLHHQQASWPIALCISVSVLPMFLSTMTTQLLETVPRLHQNLQPLQQVLIGVSAGRLALLALLLGFWPAAIAAILLGTLPQWWANWRLRRLTALHAEWPSTADAGVRAELLVQVRRGLPGIIYFTLSGQLTVWLISLFGKTHAVAAVGALSRLGLMMTAIGTVFSIVGVPRFARVPATDHVRMTRRYWQAQGLLLAACALLVLGVGLFPGPVLWLLGPTYAGYAHEAVLTAVSATVTVMVTAALQLGAARGVITPPWLSIPVCVGLQVLLVLLVPVDTVAGVIWLGLLSALSQWIVHVAYFRHATRSPAARDP